MDFNNIGRAWNNNNYGTFTVVILSIIPLPQFDRYVRVDGDKREVIHTGRNLPDDLRESYDVHYESISLVVRELDSHGNPTGDDRSMITTKNVLSLELQSYTNVKANISVRAVDLGLEAQQAQLQKLIDNEREVLIDAGVKAIDGTATKKQVEDITKQVMVDIKKRAEKYRYQHNVRRVEIDPDSNLATRIASIVSMYGIDGAGKLASALV